MNALPSFVVPQAGEVLAGRAFSLRPLGTLAPTLGEVLAARSRAYLPSLATLYQSSGGGAAPTYVQNRLLGRGSASGTGIAEALAVGTNLVLSGTTLNCTATGGGGGGGLDPNSSIYPPFVVGADDDEFNDGVFSGWTSVNSGNNVPTVTETNNVASVSLPGGHASAELAAYVKVVTPAVGDYIEIVFRGMGRAQTFNLCGLVMADGVMYGSGTQAIFYASPQEVKWSLNAHTGYNALSTLNQFDPQYFAAHTDEFLRLKYTAANTFRGYSSPDGVSWVDVTGPVGVTVTPTVIGFFASTWGGTLPFVWSVRYFRKGP